MNKNIKRKTTKLDKDATLDKETILDIVGVSKSYGNTRVLNNISLTLKAGETLALVGSSGCGKSTLLHLAGLLDNPTSGKIFINNKDVSMLNDSMQTKTRNQDIGFIYQFHNLLPEFSVWENVAYPMWINGVRGKVAKNKALALLGNVDMDEFANKKISTLSGGQAQRVAIARALANDPKIVLADEPTGNLDVENSAKVWKVLVDAVKKHGVGLLCVTHDLQLAKKSDKIATITNYKVVLNG